jgi:hypothetical protein
VREPAVRPNGPEAQGTQWRIPTARLNTDAETVSRFVKVSDATSSRRTGGRSGAWRRATAERNGRGEIVELVTDFWGTT